MTPPSSCRPCHHTLTKADGDDLRREAEGTERMLGETRPLFNTERKGTAVTCVQGWCNGTYRV